MIYGGLCLGRPSTIQQGVNAIIRKIEALICFLIVELEILMLLEGVKTSWNLAHLMIVFSYC